MTQMTQNTHSHGRRVSILLLLVFAVAATAFAQSTMIKGKVVDVKGQPMVGIAIAIEVVGGTRKLSTKTDKRGEFIQLLTESGQYRITATDAKVGTAQTELRVSLGRVSEANMVLAASTAANNDAKAAELKKAFEEGVAASRGGNHDEAIARFQAALALSPNCFDCLYNIGVAYLAKKDDKQAEESWKKSLELKADYAEALNALSTLYNNQKRFDEASAMGAKAAAAGGGGADATFNQGVILWNQGKIAEAKAKFEETIKTNPTHADAHYQLGMALLNEGKLPEAVGAFEAYVKLDPNGQYATQAKGMIAQLKK
ncbi:MAG: tetratricopeptide repeat protein [Acidobacteria bacterium]|nr:tetratricopeptide repeat protein [Acidobacteriota bacterium]